MNMIAPAPATAVPPMGRLARLTVGQYHQMAEAGVLKSGAPIELLEGVLVRKMTLNPPHNASVRRITRRLARLLPEEWILSVQGAITLKESEPEPDFAVIAGPEDKYDSCHPGPRDIALLIEVADSSLMDDRRYKAVLYARARIPQLWILNLVDSVVEVYTSPKGGKKASYQERHDFGQKDAVPLTLGGREIARLAVSELIP